MNCHARVVSTDEATPVGVVVGENVKRLRETYQLTQAELARRAQGYGLPWSRSHVAALEAGNREQVELGALVLLAEALGCRVPELFEGDGLVRLSAQAQTTRAGLVGWLTGQSHGPLNWTGAAGRRQKQAERSIRVTGSGPQDPDTRLYRWYDITPVQADAELAGRLGVRPEVVIRTAEMLWGRTLHQERDRRVAELADDLTPAQRRARRGHITRLLAREVEREALSSKRSRRQRKDQL